MDLSSIKDKKAESSQYMVDEITKVIKTFGKRDPGSEGEKKACEYMAEQLGEYCDDVKIEPFEVRPASFMGWIYLSVPLVALAVILMFFIPIVSMFLILAAMVIMLGQFLLYRQMIDKLFKAKTSYNVTAVKKPKGEIKRRVFYNGHPDAACEWTVNYHLGGVGFIAHFLITMFAIAYWFILIVIALAMNGAGFEVVRGGLRIAMFVGLIFTPFLIAMCWLWNEKIVVDGANDNLTGCYMGIAIMKALKESGIELENTEVGVIISGSEEAGLRGAKAWTKAHADDYKDAETLIFAYDTIHDGRLLMVNRKDLNGFVKADDKASDMFLNAAKKLNVQCGEGSVPLGATDSAAFNQGGFKATGITALDHNLKDYYHTRKDTIGNLDPVGLADCFAVSVQMLEDYDNE